MRAALLLALLGLCALAQATHVSYCAQWDVDYKINRKTDQFKEIVKGDFANEAFDRVTGCVTANAVKVGHIPKTCKLVDTTKLEGCYESLFQWKGKQYQGAYGFVYKALYKCGKDYERLTFAATTLAFRPHPHFKCDWVVAMHKV